MMASLLLLFGVICIYTHGTWFFVVSTSVLLGFSVCFLPFAVYTKPLRTLLGNEKPLPVFRPFIWRIDTIDGNVKWLILISCSIAGIILIVSGIIKQAKKKKLKSKNS
ncbi:MAG: hypothetical protein HDR17_02070 [Lachnospiraceae bacterium]|nr:hypothetical protein [Lachnospiraceae bacterium]